METRFRILFALCAIIGLGLTGFFVWAIARVVLALT
jgi:hypothetical protein